MLTAWSSATLAFLVQCSFRGRNGVERQRQLRDLPSHRYLSPTHLAVLRPSSSLVSIRPKQLSDRPRGLSTNGRKNRSYGMPCDSNAMSGEGSQDSSFSPDLRRREPRTMHSGVGRIARLRMDTMTLFELGISSGAVSLGALLDGDSVAASLGSIAGIAGIADLLCRGGWPQAVGKTTADAMRIAAAYIDGVCESDVSRADGVKRDPVKVRALLSSLARNESTLAGMRSIERDLGVDVSKNTITGYMDALRRINIVDDVPAWHPALRSPVKLRQGAKRHLADSSLAVALIGADPESLSSDPKTLGLLFESLVLHDLKVYAAASDATVSHYHDADDLEVDAIVHRRDGSWVAVEVKLGSPQVPEAVENLLRLERKLVDRGERPPAAKLIVIGFGMPAHVTSEGIVIAPVDTLGV